MYLKLGKTESLDFMNLKKVSITAGTFINIFSVFYQFQGRFGPTAISVTNTNNILVSLFEFNALA